MLINLFLIFCTLYTCGDLGMRLDRWLIERRFRRDFPDGSGIPTPARSHVGAVHPIVTLARLSQSPAVDSERPSGDGRAILRAVK